MGNHRKWIEKFDLPNSIIAREHWDCHRVQELAKAGFAADVMYLLSSFHWMDKYCREKHQYPHSGRGSVSDDADNAVNLMAKLLSLASLHVIELPSFTNTVGWVHL